MKYNVDFKIVNKLGQLELGAGVRVICEVYSLFWKEFSIVMTRGERVPFMQHDYFVEEWEAVGRVIVKGYVSISYIHTYIHTSLFNNAGYENWQDQSPDVDLANYS